jgi:GNAT superfamily N-acetyltransferase
MQLTSPVSEADYNAYYELRWKILRAPWNQPRGSERDDREADSTHLMVVEGNGAVAGVGRLHFNGISEAQIRYMAVAVDHRRQGIGTRILAALEDRDCPARRPSGSKRPVPSGHGLQFPA